MSWDWMLKSHYRFFQSHYRFNAADLSDRGRLRSATFRYEHPLLKRKYGERSFSYAGPKAWDDLPPFGLQELIYNL